MTDNPSSVKITVLRCFRPEEVFKDPPVEAALSRGKESDGPCPAFKDGQEFILAKDKGEFRPEGFCPWAWESLFWGFVALRSGADFPYWYEDKGAAVWACPDGLRPVIFKLERI